MKRMTKKSKSGAPSKEKAAEMLRDGTAHQKPLTPAQKRYFSMLAHAEIGLPVSPIVMQARQHMLNSTQQQRLHLEHQARQSQRAYQIGGEVSRMGYRDDSPYRNAPSLDIHTPDGSIDMSQTGLPILANGVYLPPYSGTHYFEPGVVKERPVQSIGKSQTGGGGGLKMGGVVASGRGIGDVQKAKPYFHPLDASTSRQLGGRTPIITNNPNDPRLRASLSKLGELKDGGVYEGDHIDERLVNHLNSMGYKVDIL